MRKQTLYFIAIIPSDEVCEQVTAFKQHLADEFETKAALRTIPHITLKAPFNIALEDRQELIGWFESLSLTVSSFRQELKNFGSFKNKKPVIFIHPVMNASLSYLHKEIMVNFKTQYPNVPLIDHDEFSPHMTIAYRDLKRHLFKEAWKEYSGKEFYAVFEVSSIKLLEHDGKKWNITSTRSLAT